MRLDVVGPRSQIAGSFRSAIDDPHGRSEWNWPRRNWFIPTSGFNLVAAKDIKLEIPTAAIHVELHSGVRLDILHGAKTTFPPDSHRHGLLCVPNERVVFDNDFFAAIVLWTPFTKACRECRLNCLEFGCRCFVLHATRSRWCQGIRPVVAVS